MNIILSKISYFHVVLEVKDPHNNAPDFSVTKSDTKVPDPLIPMLRAINFQMNLILSKTRYFDVVLETNKPI